MKRALGVLGVAAVLAASSAASGADDAKQITARQAAAMANVASFQLTSNALGGMNSTVTFVKPARVRMAMSLGVISVEMIMVDGIMYQRQNGGTWGASRMPSSATVMASMHLSPPTAGAAALPEVLPDRVEEGTSVGVLRTRTHVPSIAGQPARDVTLTCSYDKTTYLPRTCAMDGAPNQGSYGVGAITMTYGHWNDPANVVEAPAGVATPPPAPSASPAAPVSPSASPAPG